jgi:hypothetical protein
LKYFYLKTNFAEEWGEICCNRIHYQHTRLEKQEDGDSYEVEINECYLVEYAIKIPEYLKENIKANLKSKDEFEKMQADYKAEEEAKKVDSKTEL